MNGAPFSLRYRVYRDVASLTHMGVSIPTNPQPDVEAAAATSTSILSFYNVSCLFAQALYIAAKRGDKPSIISLLKGGADVLGRNEVCAPRCSADVERGCARLSLGNCTRGRPGCVYIYP